MVKLDGSLSTRFMGKRIARKEDARFLTGHGTFVDDVRQPGTLEVAFARSDIARGTITRVDVSVAREMPGVKAVYVGAELNDRVVDYNLDDELALGRDRIFR